MKHALTLFAARTLLFLAAAILLCSPAYAQTPPPAGDPNEIWLDVTYPGEVDGEITQGKNFSLDFHIANSATLGANTNGFRIWSPDGVTWSYRTNSSWYGSDPSSRGVQDKHVSVSGRWVGAYDGTIAPILVPNPLLGGSAGPAEDSIMIGGVAVFAPGLPAGPLANIVQLNMTMGDNLGTWCVDSVTRFPPAGQWIFSSIGSGDFFPTFVGPFCWTVVEGPEFVCGDANGDGYANIADAIFLIDWLLKGGIAPPVLEAADTDCSGEHNIVDIVVILDWIFRGGPGPCCL
jgi:hypothetical protein